MKLDPGWAERFGSTLATGTKDEIEDATGMRHGPPFRIDYARRAESSSRGGKKNRGKRKASPR